jgi:dTDP-4-dehydrorhamnose reductase
VNSASSSNVGSAIPVPHVLIVGGDSIIGSALNKHLLTKGYRVTSTTRRHGNHDNVSLYLDLQDQNSYSILKDRRFDTAILCGAITSIQMCEENPEQTRKVNVDGTLALANLLSDCVNHLIFLSTNLVFDGRKPYAKSSDIINPAIEYGRQKAIVEENLLTFNCKTAIIRFGKILPPNFPLFCEWLDSLRSGRCIHPHANRTMAPISLSFAIEVLMWLIVNEQVGIFQATASCDITYEDVALRLATRSRSDPALVVPINAPLLNSDMGNHSPLLTYNALDFSPELLLSFSPPTPDQALFYALNE